MTPLDQFFYGLTHPLENPDAFCIGICIGIGLGLIWRIARALDRLAPPPEPPPPQPPRPPRPSKRE